MASQDQAVIGVSQRVGPVRTKRVQNALASVHRFNSLAMAMLLSDQTPGRKSQLKARLRAQLETHDFWMDVSARKAWILLGAQSVDALGIKLNQLAIAAAKGGELFSLEIFDPEAAPRRYR